MEYWRVGEQLPRVQQESTSVHPDRVHEAEEGGGVLGEVTLFFQAWHQPHFQKHRPYAQPHYQWLPGPSTQAGQAATQGPTTLPQVTKLPASKEPPAEPQEGIKYEGMHFQTQYSQNQQSQQVQQ